jgi:hypothetical protein
VSAYNIALRVTTVGSNKNQIEMLVTMDTPGMPAGATSILIGVPGFWISMESFVGL